MQAAHSLSRVVTSDSSEVNRDVVFCPVMRSPLPRATNGDDMRVVSPELPDSLSSESPSDRAGSTSPPFLDDSLDGEATPPALKQATRKKRGDRVRSNQPQPVYIPQTASPSLIVTGLHATVGMVKTAIPLPTLWITPYSTTASLHEAGESTSEARTLQLMAARVKLSQRLLEF